MGSTVLGDSTSRVPNTKCECTFKLVSRQRVLVITMGLGEPVPTLVPWLKLVLTGSLVLGATPPPIQSLKFSKGWFWFGSGSNFFFQTGTWFWFQEQFQFQNLRLNLASSQFWNPGQFLVLEPRVPCNLWFWLQNSIISEKASKFLFED